MPTDLEARLRSALKAEAAVVTEPADMASRIERRHREEDSRRPRRGIVRLSAAAVVVLVLGTAVAIVRLSESSKERSDGRDRTVVADDGASAEIGSWQPMPEAPIGPRSDHVAVWTGREMLVFGGWNGRGPDEPGELATGAAAYDPAAGSWREITAPPDTVAVSANATVWTGEKVVAFSCPREGACHQGGWSYDPATDVWEPIASPGSLVPRPDQRAVATDFGVVALVDTGYFDPDNVSFPNSLAAALYDPANDTWSALPQLSEALDLYGVLWTGSEVVVIGAVMGDGRTSAEGGPVAAYALDPRGGEWRTLPAPPLVSDPYRTTVWTGTEIVIVSDAGTVAFDPAAAAWRSLPAVPRPYHGSFGASAAAVGRKVVVFSTADDQQQPRPLVLDVPTETWSDGPPAPGPELVDPAESAGRSMIPLVSTGDVVLLWGGGVARQNDPNDPVTGGSVCCRAVGEGMMFDPR